MVDRASSVHIPVLGQEVVSLLGGRSDSLKASGLIVDATLGAGGHSALLLEALAGVRVLGTDQDPEILDLARERLEPFGERVRFERARFSNLARLLRKLRCDRPIGWLMDVGVSSLQLDRPSRGFSFSADGPLDMRMDPSRELMAADIVNGWSEAQLADLFYKEADEHRSRPIAAAIVKARQRVPFKRTGVLAELIVATVGSGGRTHPGTKVFQALRRAVNSEGDELISGLQAAEDCLAHDGVLAVITFHSGEDAVVKKYMAEGAKEGRWELLSKKGFAASREEIRSNPRSRSARLRGVRRIRSEGASQEPLAPEVEETPRP
ncbi:MAG: 16S rRNA (cytosine(1402)-N(4))-methyltransferase RsmH [Planctomycetes bacterium]|nr:16S rRNA (cytosine(1402)-N(4))-methyltransferase RsmH [Planctomycetota bacterium]